MNQDISDFERRLDDAWTKLADGDVDGARRTATMLGDEDPSSADVTLLKAACAREAGETDEAIKLLREALATDPEWATPELWLAELLSADEDRLPDALKHARRALDLAEDEDDFLDALMLKAHLELDLGKVTAARETLGELPPRETGALPEERVVEASELLLAVDEVEEARARIDEYLDTHDDDADAWYVMGLCAEADEDDKARSHAWERCRALDRAELDRVPEPERLAEAEVVAEAEAALEELPPKARALLADVPIVVAELPAIEDVREGVDPRLLGLFVGTPYPEDSHLGSVPTLTQIILFRRNLERVSGDDEETLRDEIRKTLLHEAGHFFGMDEDALERVRLD